jgi:hypothetical protein
VSTDFDEGETVSYPGAGRVFAEWKLVDGNAGNAWPLLYAAGVAMGEKDDGGFGKFLVDLWKTIESEVTTAIAGAVGAAIGGAIGGVIGAIAGAVLGVILNWLIGLADNPDDIVAVRQFQLWLGSILGSYYDWAGLTKNPPDTFTVDFNGDGGRYRTWFSWSVVK